MTDPALIEAAARALRETDAHDTAHLQEYFRAASAVLAAVTPLIEAAALERAALMAEAMLTQPWVRDQVVAAIRALKEQP